MTEGGHRVSPKAQISVGSWERYLQLQNFSLRKGGGTAVYL